MKWMNEWMNEMNEIHEMNEMNEWNEMKWHDMKGNEMTWTNEWMNEWMIEWNDMTWIEIK